MHGATARLAQTIRVGLNIGIGLVLAFACFLFLAGLFGDPPQQVSEEFRVILFGIVSFLIILRILPAQMQILGAVFFLFLGFLFPLAEMILSIAYDFRGRAEVVRNLGGPSQGVVPAVSPALFLSGRAAIKLDGKDYFPLSGVANMTTVHCNEGGYWSLFDSDRYGFSNSDDLWQVNRPDVLLIGDSFAEGACVNPKDTIAGQIRQSNRSVLNLGKSGAGPLMELGILYEYAMDKSPRNIVWLYYDSDLEDLKAELRNETLGHYLSTPPILQNLSGIQKQMDAALLNLLPKEYWRAEKNGSETKARIKSFVTLSRVRKTLKIPVWRYEIPASEQKDAAKNLDKDNGLSRKKFSQIAALIKSYALEKDANLIFVYLSGTGGVSPEYKFVKKVIAELNIGWVDIYKSVMKRQADHLDLFPFRKEAHYSEEGYALVAAEIVKSLIW
jgi:hypothetical protein